MLLGNTLGTAFLQFQADSDGVLRRASLWLLHDGVMSPSLPLAVASEIDTESINTPAPASPLLDRPVKVSVSVVPVAVKL